MRKLILFTLVNLLVISAALAAGMYAHIAARRYFAQDVIFIVPLLNESHYHWSITNVDELKRQFWDYDFASESRTNAVLESSTQQAAVTVIYTDSAYFTMHFMEFIEGNLWQEDANTIILNEPLAWRLFGGGNIVGLAVNINQRPYTVAGVVRQDPRGIGEYMAWIPRAALHERADPPVTALFVRAINYNLVDVAVNTREMLLYQLRIPTDYTIVDINRYIEAIHVRSRVLQYILWLYILILLVKSILNSVDIYRRRVDPTQYNPRLFLNLILPLSGILLALYVLFTGVNDILYWLPNLADPNFSMLSSTTNIGLLPPDGYLPFGLRRLVWLNRLGNLAWVVGIVASINVMFCVVILRDEAACFHRRAVARY